MNPKHENQIEVKRCRNLVKIKLISADAYRIIKSISERHKITFKKRKKIPKAILLKLREMLEVRP